MFGHFVENTALPPPRWSVAVLSACASWHVESRFPDPGASVHHLRWIRRVLTAGPPGLSCPGLKHSWASFFFPSKYVTNQWLYVDI